MVTKMGEYAVKAWQWKARDKPDLGWIRGSRKVLEGAVLEQTGFLNLLTVDVWG